MSKFTVGRKIIIAFVLLLSVQVASAGNNGATSVAGPLSLLLGARQAADFTVPAIMNPREGYINFSDYKGNVILVDFCQPENPNCPAMAATYGEIYMQYAEKGYSFLWLQ